MLKQVQKAKFLFRQNERRAPFQIAGTTLASVNAYGFGNTNNMLPSGKKSAYLSKFSFQLREAQAYIRKRKNLDEAIKRFQSVLYSFNFNADVRPSDGFKALIGVGDVLFLQDKAELSLDYYLLALAFYPLNKSDQDRAELCGKIGECYFKIKDIQNSFEYFQKAIDLYRSCEYNDHSVMGNIYIYMGKIYMERKDSYQAMDYYNNAIDILEPIDQNIMLVIQAKTDMAKILCLRKENWNAWAKLYDAMSLYDSCEGFRLKDKMRIIEEFIDVLEKLSFTSEVKERYKALLQVQKENADSLPITKIAETLKGLAFVYSQDHKYEKAIEYYREALKEYDKHELDALKGDVLLQIGFCYYHNWDYDVSQEYFTRGIVNKRIHSDSESIDVGKAYYYLGKTYESEGDWEESANYFKSSLSVLKRHYEEDHEDVLEAQKSLDRVTKFMNEEQEE